VFPGVTQLLEKQVRDPRDEPQLDLCQRTAGNRRWVAPSAEQPVDDRVEDRRVDIEDQVSFQRLGPQEIEAGRVLEAEDELAVGELIDAGELHLDDASQET